MINEFHQHNYFCLFKWIDNLYLFFLKFICVNSPGEDESVNEVGISGHNEKESKSEDGDAELTEECERKSKDKVPVKTKRAADARDKGVRCKSTKVSKKKVTMQSSESLASAIKDMRNAQDEQRQND